jgi:hypothetical protein
LSFDEPNYENPLESVFEQENAEVQAFDQQIEQDYAPAEEYPSSGTVPGSESALTPQEEEQIAEEMNENTEQNFNDSMNQAEEFDQDVLAPDS